MKLGQEDLARQIQVQNNFGGIMLHLNKIQSDVDLIKIINKRRDVNSHPILGNSTQACPSARSSYKPDPFPGSNLGHLIVMHLISYFWYLSTGCLWGKRADCYP